MLEGLAGAGEEGSGVAMNQQNCNLCDKPVWLMLGGYYDMKDINMSDQEDHCVVVLFKPHECKEKLEKREVELL